ncbi:MAG TPA: hypothetical protein VGO60_10325 [Iamia sp.]|nr:hypothetical protein [Iamia sp.]
MPSPFGDLFLTADPASAERLRALVDGVIDALATSRPDGPRSDLTLVGRSLDTSRRFDALKVVTALASWAGTGWRPWSTT